MTMLISAATASLRKFFYPTVSLEATWRGNIREGAVANEVFALLEGTPKRLVFTPNSENRIPGCRWTYPKDHW